MASSWFGLQLVVLAVWLCVVLSAESSYSSRYEPIALESGWSKWAQLRWESAKQLAHDEQAVEDYNAEWIASCKTPEQTTTFRRLICMPLTDIFDPPLGAFSHGHVQTGDKMSLPPCFWQAIQSNHAEVPWLFSVTRVEGITRDRVETSDSQHTDKQPGTLDTVVGGPLDFRAPPNHVFLPWWMMRAMGLQPRDVVDVQMIQTVPPGSLAKLRPHSRQFAKDIANPQAVLETELRHYSALTQGSTIAFDYNQKRYWFDVEELRSAPRGEKQPMIKVQDCDIATDFLVSRDEMKQKKKRQPEV